MFQTIIYVVNDVPVILCEFVVLQQLRFLLQSLLEELWPSSPFLPLPSSTTSCASGKCKRSLLWIKSSHTSFIQDVFCVRPAICKLLRYILTTADNDNQLTISWTVNSFSTDLWLLCLAAVKQTVTVRCRCWFNLNQRLLQWLTTTLLTTSNVRLTSLRPAKHHHLLIICLDCL